MALVLPIDSVWPLLGRDVFVAPNATLVGDIELGDASSVWFGAVLRADIGPIRIGARTNIQDLACVHLTGGESSTAVGVDVTVGHSAILHGCTIGDRCLIGMGAIILDNAVIGEDSLIGAGALIPPRTVIPPRSYVLGRPGRVLREVTEAEARLGPDGAAHYVENARRFLALCGGSREGAPPGSWR